ncbi:MAG: tail fiber domain-containing protein [Deltaproteobacteria bacterium]|nr:tail fiber domain-containing protein [Deltaproteobacteria bacterium]
MKTKTILCLLSVVLFACAGNAFGSVPTAISPEGVIPVVEGNRPLFIWSGVEGAVAYRLDVFRSETEGVPLYEEMKAVTDPLLSNQMSAHVLSWRPPSAECFDPQGAYVWYVQAIGCDGQGNWSKGKPFVFSERTVLSPRPSLTEDLYNTFVGDEAGNSNTTGYYNIFAGSQSGYSNTSGDNHAFLGYASGYSNTTGSNNTFIGYEAGYSNTSGYCNTFLGSLAGYSSTTAEHNCFLGYRSGYSNTTGYLNTFLGYMAGTDNTTGGNNTFVGYVAGRKNTTGYYNTCLGNNAGYSNTEGSRNVFLGNRAGYYETGSNKLYIDNSDTSNPLVYGDFGTNSLQVNGTLRCTSRLLTNGASAWGSAPFVLGQDTLNRGIIITDKAASNQKNIYFGWNVGETHEYAEIFALQEDVEYKNLVFNPNGANVGIRNTTPLHPLHMGSGAYVSTGGVWTNASSREYKKDIKQLTAEKAMDALTRLNPVEFAYKADSEEKHVGFIAEEAPSLVATKDRKGMSPMDVVAVLTRVVQQQNETIGRLSKRVAELEKRTALR